MEDGNVLLQAGIIEEVLRLRLIVSENVDNANVYTGEINSLDSYEQLR